MSLTINTNVDAIVANNDLVNTQNSLSMAMQDLSSGLRINTAADDAARLCDHRGPDGPDQRPRAGHARTLRTPSRWSRPPTEP